MGRSLAPFITESSSTVSPRVAYIIGMILVLPTGLPITTAVDIVHLRTASRRFKYNSGIKSLLFKNLYIFLNTRYRASPLLASLYSVMSSLERLRAVISSRTVSKFSHLNLWGQPSVILG